MKSIKLIILVIISAIVSQDVFAQNEKCERKVDVKSATYVPTRGKNPIIRFDGKKSRNFLKCPQIGKKRGLSPKCTISIDNDFDKEVDVYIDRNYIGSIRANDKGVIENLDAYAEVYCVSADYKYFWKENGDCACNFVFRLSKETR